MLEDIDVNVVKKIDQEVKADKIESEEEYKRLFELSPDTICVHSGGKIVLANPAAERLFNMKDTKGIIGRNIMEFIHPDYVNSVKSRISAIYEGAMATPFTEEKVLANDGSVIDVEVGTSAFQ